ncbi:MAG: DUF6498-containing protein [Planctomycetota bacterium]
MAQIPQFFYRYLLDTARRSARSIIVIILIDLLPLFAIWYLDWNTFNLVFIYFIETFVLIAFTWFKMRRAHYLLAVLGPRKADGNQRSEDSNEGADSDVEAADTESADATAGEQLETTQSQPQRWLGRFGIVFRAIRSLLWLLRPIFGSGFLFLNIPLAWLQLYLLSWLGGDGWSPMNFVNHDLGQLGFGWLAVPLLPLAIVLLVAEHGWFYWRNYLGKQEFANTGLINEGIRFQMRTVVQLVVMFCAIGLLFSESLSLPAAIALISIKIVLDVGGFLWNRAWGGAKNKLEGSR